MPDTRRLDEIISDIEDVAASLEHVQTGESDPEVLTDAHDALERVTDGLEEVEEDISSLDERQRR